MSRKTKSTTTAPGLRVIVEKTVQLTRLRDEVLSSYRWLHGIATTKGAIRSLGPPREPREGDDQPAPAYGDEVGEQAIGTLRAVILAGLPIVGTHLHDAVSSMEQALTSLQKLERKYLGGVTVDAQLKEDPSSFLRRGELTESRSAKARREARGEGWGAA